MSHQKPTGDSGQGGAPDPDKARTPASPKPHGDKLKHAVEEAAAPKAPKDEA